MSQFQPQDGAPHVHSMAFQMGAMTQALPPPMHSAMTAQGHFNQGAIASAQPPHGTFQMQQQSLLGGRIQPMNVATVQSMQQAPYIHSAYASFKPSQHSILQMQPPAHYGKDDGCGHSGMFNTHQNFGVGQVQIGEPGRMSSTGEYFLQHSQCSHEPTPPFISRGPPSKPKRSDPALWVGNLPPTATLADLKDYFSQDARNEIESLFLISKTNCAFVNYRSEAACVDAVDRFHNSDFCGRRLVCRLRSSSMSSLGSASAMSKDVRPSEARFSTSSRAGVNRPAAQDSSAPIIVNGSHDPSLVQKSAATAYYEPPVERVSKKFFILKSLTVQDLESSVRSGIWATQNHNESKLNQAFEEADEVYLIFSANQSGEYFGYARMTSPTSGEPVRLNANVESNRAFSIVTPHVIPTPATATAPKGHIIDDSARGIIFWEAENRDQSNDDDKETSKKKEAKAGYESIPGSVLSREVSIQWISTNRLPFYRTRGLRNPFNANREIKIARDGTELEPSVGRRLVQMFHQPPQTHGP